MTSLYPSAVILSEMFDKIKTEKENKLIQFMDLSGVEWHFSDKYSKRFIAQPSVKISALGGIPFVRYSEKEIALANTPELPFNIKSYNTATKNMMAYSGMMSYLNASDFSEVEMIEKLIEKQHMSVAHTVNVSLLVSGISTAVENEFNSQRDLVHLSRITVSRTKVQDDPPICVPYYMRHLLPSFIEVYESVLNKRQNFSDPNMDTREVLNQMFPTAKATAFIMTGSLRNFMKLFSGIDDTGKEREYREILHLCKERLSIIWPELF